MSLPRAKPNKPRSAPCAAVDCRACEFRGLTFCAGLKDLEIGELAAIVTRLCIAPQQMVFQEGDSAAHVFNVTSGVVKLYKLLLDGRRQITGFLLPGDFLGLASRGGYSYSAEAVNEVSLCRFPRHRLETVFDRFPRLQRRLFDIANDELVAAQDQMLLLGRRTAEVTLKSGEKLALGGFRIIDEGKFNALSSEVFLEWRQRGWLHLVYSHLMSLSNWAGLVDRTAAGEG